MVLLVCSTSSSQYSQFIVLPIRTTLSSYSELQGHKCTQIPTAKVHLPNLLLPITLTQTQFDIWSAELQAWLVADDTRAQFLPGALYGTWQSEEQNPLPIAEACAGDPDLSAEPTQAQKYSVTAKPLSQCYAISLTWVLKLIKRDYDLSHKD